MHSDIVAYFGHESVSLQALGKGVVPVERLAIIFDLLIYAVIVAGAAAAMFPHLRGRWVEWRFRLTSDDRAIMTEIQRFVSFHDPSISLRVSIRSDQMARIYPAGWRGARIAVFRPLAALWRRDREAAQAVLLHEVAHRRQGDQLIVGLGSPFVMLMRIWAPAYLLLVFIPVAVYLAAGAGAQATLIAISSITQATVIPAGIFLPVTALWLAELGADQLAVHAIGPDAVRRALRSTAGSRTTPVARALALLSHPPRRLRLRLAAARPAGMAGLVAAWPAALAAWLLVLPVALTAPALLLLGAPAGFIGTSIKADGHSLLGEGRPVIIATAIVLLAWPALEYPWERLWSSAPCLCGRQPWWPYLAVASLPIGMLLASLVPLPASLPAPVTTLKRPTGICAKVANWEGGRGQAQANRVQADAYKLLGGSAITAAAARHLDNEIRAALDNPPPGPARSTYVKAMTGYGAAVTQLQAGNSTAANNTVANAAGQALKVYELLARLGERCLPS